MEKCCSITFTGDIAFSGYFDVDKYGLPSVDNELCSFFSTSDYVVANIEGPITDNIAQSKRSLNHASSPKCLELLEKLHINVWSLGNNHVCDAGKSGLMDTLEVAKSLGIPTIGAGADLAKAATSIIVGDDVKIGLLGITKPWDYVMASKNKPGTLSWKSASIIKEEIAKIKENVDYVVLIVHGGDEFTTVPMPYVRDTYIKLLGYGADIIVGHHPHVIQNYEKLGDKIIFYSLGNFIFDTDYQRIQQYTDIGLLLKLKFSKAGFAFEYVFAKNVIGKSKLVSQKEFDVFRNISATEYEKIWPFYASELYTIKQNAYAFKLRLLKKSFVPMRLLKNAVQSLTTNEGRVILRGKLLALFR